MVCRVGRFGCHFPRLRDPAQPAESSDGTIADGSLEVEPGWRRQSIRVSYSGASRLANAERIEELRRLARGDDG